MMNNIVKLTTEQIDTVGPKLSDIFDLINFDEVESSYVGCETNRDY